MTLRTESDLTSKWIYDPTNGIGQLSNACTASTCSSASYQQRPTYNTLGQVASGRLTVDGTTYTYTPAYNTDGQVSQMTYPSGFVAKYTYTSLGYLSKIKDNLSGLFVWQALGADAEGRLTQHKAANGVTTNAVYDAPTGNLLNICATSNSGACDGNVANFSYTWDGIGNLSSRADTYQGYTETFCYDALNRVVNSRLASVCTGAGTKAVVYDAIGNIKKKNDVCTAANCFVYGSGAGPHALTSIVGTYNGVTNPSFTYDGNGNMTGGAGFTIGYTSYNMANAVAEGTTTAALVYGPWHNRTKMCVPDCTSPTTTTYYLYDPATGGRSEKIVSGASVIWKDYVTAPGVGLVAVRTNNNGTVTWRYVVPDHLGSVSAVTDAGSPPAVERLSYDSWGKRRNADGSDNTACAITAQLSRGYTSHEMLDSTCLINMNARIYDPSLGRFQSADPIIPDPINTQAFNRYSYVTNNPLAFVDPSGHEEIETVVVWGYRIPCQNGCGCGGLNQKGPDGLGGGGGGDGTDRDKDKKNQNKICPKNSAMTGFYSGITFIFVADTPELIGFAGAALQGAALAEAAAVFIAFPYVVVAGVVVGTAVYAADRYYDGAISDFAANKLALCTGE